MRMKNYLVKLKGIIRCWNILALLFSNIKIIIVRNKALEEFSAKILKENNNLLVNFDKFLYDLKSWRNMFDLWYFGAKYL